MEIRPTTDADLDAYISTMHLAFGRFPDSPVDGEGHFWSAIEMDRCLMAVTPEGRGVGTAGAYSFELTLPGETVVPVAAVTGVGVVPTHRRRGVLTAMMRYQLAELRSRGDFLAVLLSSEAPIYGRFGYGPATHTSELRVPSRSGFTGARGGAPVAEAGTIEVLARDNCVQLMEAVYDRYRRATPGALSRPHRWWERQAGQSPTSPAPRYIALHRDASGAPDGYACYARGEDQTLAVDEIVSTDDAVYIALARFLLDHDLATTVEFSHVPLDHPLRWHLSDLRAGEAKRQTDWLWVRLLDIPRALTARGWFTDGHLVLDVHDPFLQEQGRYRLSVRDGKAECELTDASPDLTLDVRDLGTIYLGDTAPSTLARAGHIRSRTTDAAARADALFRGNRSPHCLHWF